MVYHIYNQYQRELHDHKIIDILEYIILTRPISFKLIMNLLLYRWEIGYNPPTTPKDGR